MRIYLPQEVVIIRRYLKYHKVFQIHLTDFVIYPLKRREEEEWVFKSVHVSALNIHLGAATSSHACMPCSRHAK